MKIIWTLLKPERTQNPERAQNVLQLRSGFSTEHDFQDFRFSTTFWF